MTIVNTGTRELRPGDTVRMVIDVLDIARGYRTSDDLVTGIPRTKIVARLEPTRPDSHEFADLAAGINSRSLQWRLFEPSVLIPRIEYMGRERFPWDWNHTGGAHALERELRASDYEPLPTGVGNDIVALEAAMLGGGFMALRARDPAWPILRLPNALGLGDGEVNLADPVRYQHEDTLAAWNAKLAEVNNAIGTMRAQLMAAGAGPSIGHAVLIIVRALEMAIATQGDIDRDVFFDNAINCVDEFGQYIVNHLTNDNLAIAVLVTDFRMGEDAPDRPTSQLIAFASALNRLLTSKRMDENAYAARNASLNVIAMRTEAARLWTDNERAERRATNAAAANTYLVPAHHAAEGGAIFDRVRAVQAVATLEYERYYGTRGGEARLNIGVSPAILAKIWVDA